jgi:hypothetical protein
MATPGTMNNLVIQTVGENCSQDLKDRPALAD